MAIVFVGIDLAENEFAVNLVMDTASRRSRVHRSSTGTRAKLHERLAAAMHGGDAGVLRRVPLGARPARACMLNPRRRRKPAAANERSRRASRIRVSGNERHR